MVHSLQRVAESNDSLRLDSKLSAKALTTANYQNICNEITGWEQRFPTLKSTINEMYTFANIFEEVEAGAGSSRNTPTAVKTTLSSSSSELNHEER